VPVELINLSVFVLLLGLLISSKQPWSTLRHCLFPGMDLAGMNFKPAGQFGDGLIPLQGGQGYLGLEGWAMLLPRLLYVPAPLFLSF